MPHTHARARSLSVSLSCIRVHRCAATRDLTTLTPASRNPSLTHPSLSRSPRLLHLHPPLRHAMATHCCPDGVSLHLRLPCWGPSALGALRPGRRAAWSTSAPTASTWRCAPPAGRQSRGCSTFPCTGPHTAGCTTACRQTAPRAPATRRAAEGCPLSPCVCPVGDGRDSWHSLPHPGPRRSPKPCIPSLHVQHKAPSPPPLQGRVASPWIQHQSRLPLHTLPTLPGRTLALVWTARLVAAACRV